MKLLKRSRKVWWFAAFLFAMALAIVITIGESDQAVLFRTLKLSLGAAAVAIPVAMVFALFVSNGSIGNGLKRGMVLLLIALAVMPPYLNVSSWDAAFGKLGWLTSAQGQILQPLLSKWSAAIWVHAIGLVPSFTLLFIAATGQRRAMEEQAKMDLRPSDVFLYITLRRVFPLVMACVLWSILVCSREIGVTDLYQIGTFAEQIYLGYSLGQINSIVGRWSAEEIAAAGSIPIGVRVAFFLFLASASTAFFSLLTDFSKDNVSMIAAPVEPPRRLGRRMLPILGSVIVLVILMAAPLFNLIFQLGTEVVIVGEHPTRIWALSNCYAIIQKSFFEFSGAFVWSSLISLMASLVIIVTATVVCFFAKSNRVAWWAMVGITSLAATFSGPDIGSGLVALLAQSQSNVLLWLYDRTIFPAVIANIIFCWPMAVVVVWFAICQTPADQLESAQLDPVGFFRRTFEFGFLQNRSLLGGVWMLVGAICFTELSASQMVLPPGVETVAQVTLGKLHAGVSQSTAALSLLTIGLVVAMAVIGWIIGIGGIGVSRHHRAPFK